MIKKSTYIRKFTEKQLRQMEKVQVMNGKLKTVPDILFYSLDRFLELEKDNERLQRIISYKQRKIDRLT